MLTYHVFGLNPDQCNIAVLGWGIALVVHFDYLLTPEQPGRPWIHGEVAVEGSNEVYSHQCQVLTDLVPVEAVQTRT